MQPLSRPVAAVPALPCVARASLGSRGYRAKCRVFRTLDNCPYSAFDVSPELSLALGIVGGIIGNLVVGWLFYPRSGRQLRAEAQNLRAETVQARAERVRVRRLVNTLARALDTAGVIHATWGPDGELADLVIINLTGAASGRASVSGSLTVITSENLDAEHRTRRNHARRAPPGC